MKQVLVCVVVFLFVGCLQIFGAEKEIKAVGVTDSGVLLLDDECTFALYENGKEAKVDSIRWKVYNRTDTPGGFMQFKESAEPVFRYKVEAGAYKRNLDILTRIDAPQGGDVYFQTVVGCTYWEGGQGKSLSLPFYVNLLPSASAVINPLAIS